MKKRIYAGAAASATLAGSPYSIVPSAATGSGLGNYTIAYHNGTLTVNPKALDVTAHVEDPGAFTTPWTALQRYRRVEQGPLREQVCAENNDKFFNYDVDPIPQADKPDF